MSSDLKNKALLGLFTSLAIALPVSKAYADTCGCAGPACGGCSIEFGSCDSCSTDCSSCNMQGVNCQYISWNCP